MALRGSVGWILVLAACLALAGCSSDDPPTRTTPRPTPIAKIDSQAVRLLRADFCDRVPGSASTRALGAAATSDESWANGEPVPGATGSGDVGHEIGCAWTAADGAIARAWVFARPVTATLAGSLVRQAGRQDGCTAAAAPVFGSPSVLQTCTLTGGVQRVRRAGLFGDTWLTCEVSGSAEQLPARTDAWCAAVVAAVDEG
jgi:hypothetical protein